MSKAKDAATIVQYRCKKCNAPYPLGADDVIATCPYCGHTFKIEGGRLVKHAMVGNTLTEAQAKSTAMQWLKRVSSKSVGSSFVKSVSVDMLMLQWIPMFKISSSASVYFLGGKQRKKGDSTYWEKVEEQRTEDTVEWVLARRHAAYFGMEELRTSLGTAEGGSFEIDRTAGATVLNAEIDDNDAMSRSKQQKSEHDRSQIRERVDQLFDYRLDMDHHDCQYTHVPYWLARYTHKNGTFRLALSGASGKVVLGELPVTKRYRLSKWLKSFFMLIGAALVLQALPYIASAVLSSSDSDDGGAFLIPVFLLFAGAVLWVGAYKIFGGVLKYEVCVTGEGDERREEFSMRGALRSIGRQVS